MQRLNGLMIIESKQNTKIAHIRRLNHNKKYRQEHQQFVLESAHVITDTLTHHSPDIVYLVTTPEHTSLRTLAKQNNIPHFLCTKRCAAHAAATAHPSGCFAVVSQKKWPLPATTPPLFLALCGIRNPSNCGAIIRNAIALHCKALYFIGDNCDPYHPESIRASNGLITQLPLFSLESLSHLPPAATWLVDSTGGTPLSDVPITPPCGFIFGSEMGFSDLDTRTIPRCTIPMSPACDSLNVAVSTALVLYHCHLSS